MTDPRACHGCREPVQGTVLLCTGCTRRLGGWLRDLPGLDAELTVTLTRQDNVTPPSEGSRPLLVVPALPYNVAASDLQEDLHGKLREWAKDAHDVFGAPARQNSPGRCLWVLKTYLRVFRKHESGPALYDEIQELHQQMRHVIDIPPTYRRIHQCATITLGQPCPGTLTLDADRFTCDTCGTQWTQDMWDHLASLIGATPADDQWIDIKTAAARLGLSRRRATEIISEAGIPYVTSASNPGTPARYYQYGNIKQLADSRTIAA